MIITYLFWKLNLADFTSKLEETIKSHGNDRRKPIPDSAIHLKIFPLGLKDVASIERDVLDRRAVSLWNACNRVEGLEIDEGTGVEVSKGRVSRDRLGGSSSD